MAMKVLLLTAALGLATAVTLSAQQPAGAASLFAKTCASCHGAAGTPTASMKTSMGVPDFAVAATLASVPDSALRAIVMNGKGRMMPAYKSRLTPEQIATLVSYIRTFSKH
jgi:cytochrome c oxidase cbb3-type subunit 3